MSRFVLMGKRCPGTSQLLCFTEFDKQMPEPYTPYEIVADPDTITLIFNTKKRTTFDRDQFNSVIIADEGCETPMPSKFDTRIIDEFSLEKFKELNHNAVKKISFVYKDDVGWTYAIYNGDDEIIKNGVTKHFSITDDDVRIRTDDGMSKTKLKSTTKVTLGFLGVDFDFPKPFDSKAFH